MAEDAAAASGAVEAAGEISDADSQNREERRDHDNRRRKVIL